MLVRPLVFILLLLLTSIIAIAAPQGSESSFALYQKKLSTWQQSFSIIDRRIQNISVDKGASFSYLKERIRQKKDVIEAFRRGLFPTINTVTRRVDTLSLPEESAAFEPSDFKAIREEAREHLAQLQGFDRQSLMLIEWGDDLLKKITRLERAQWQREIFQRDSRTLFAPVLWKTAGEDLLKTIILFSKEGVSFDGTGPQKAKHLLGVLLLAAVCLTAFIIFVFFPLLSFLIKKLYPLYTPPTRHHTVDEASREQDALKQRLKNALLYLICGSLLAYIGLYTGLYLTGYAIGARGISTSFLTALLHGSFFFILSYQILMILLFGSLFDTRKIWTHYPLFLIGLFLSAVYVLSLYGIALNNELHSLFQTEDVALLELKTLSGLFKGGIALLGAALILSALVLLTRGIFFTAGDEENISQEGLWIWKLVYILLVFASLITLGAAIFGYTTLGFFLIRQLIWLLLLLGGAKFLMVCISAFVSPTEEAAPSEIEGWFEEGKFEEGSFQKSRTNQLRVILAGFFSLLLFCSIFILAAHHWGVYTADIVELALRSAGEFGLTRLNISFSALFLAAFILLAGIFLTRQLQFWLEFKYFPNTRLDIGLQGSLKTACGYLGIGLSVLIALSYIGLNLKNIALIAGALSVGIGFGLQSIVNNFVSGLILLIERPIKVGDWVIIGTEEGTVKKVNVRTTELETFERCSVIIPNSALITGNVRNWMHRNKMGRFNIPIGASYASSPAQIEDILIDCAKSCPLVLSDPSPKVYFMGFGNSSLNFELRGYIANIDNILAVCSQLRFDILKKFREVGIDIPFPQQDVHMRILKEE